VEQSNGQPRFDQMAAWWSSKANGHQSSINCRVSIPHYKTWRSIDKQGKQWLQVWYSGKANEKRIRSKTHIANILKPAAQHQPAVSDHHNASMVIMTWSRQPWT
jgi:hypothetical protein